MFKEMRRKDRKLEKQEALEILKNNNYGILSTISSNGYPYGIPLNYVYFNNKIYLHGATEGQKFENLSKDNNVSFCVIGKAKTVPNEFSTNYESAVVFGKAYEVPESDRRDVFMEFLNKYSSDYIKEGIEYMKKVENSTRLIQIDIEHVSGKARR